MNVLLLPFIKRGMGVDFFKIDVNGGGRGGGSLKICAGQGRVKRNGRGLSRNRGLPFYIKFFQEIPHDTA